MRFHRWFLWSALGIGLPAAAAAPVLFECQYKEEADSALVMTAGPHPKSRKKEILTLQVKAGGPEFPDLRAVVSKDLLTQQIEDGEFSIPFSEGGADPENLKEEDAQLVLTRRDGRNYEGHLSLRFNGLQERYGTSMLRASITCLRK